MAKLSVFYSAILAAGVALAGVVPEPASRLDSREPIHGNTFLHT